MKKALAPNPLILVLVVSAMVVQTTTPKSPVVALLQGRGLLVPMTTFAWHGGLAAMRAGAL